LATRDRVLDAAETVFADKGFDGATIRDIASEADEPIGSVHHHGKGKETLFHQIVARRAEPLSRRRLDALNTLRTTGDVTLESLLGAFMHPFFDLARDDARWRSYARVVAFVSTDDRWQALAADYFDPTADVFLKEFTRLLPGTGRREVAEGFVYCVSAILALLTSQGRIGGLGGDLESDAAQINRLIAFCAAGLKALQGRA
jgi:AcrR family transcriptional regulator